MSALRLSILFAWLACLAAPVAAAPPSAERRLEALADAFVAARLERDPDIAYRFGVPLSRRLQGRLLDRSPEGQRRFDSSVDRLSRRLAGIRADRLDRDHRLLHAVLSEELLVHSLLRSCHSAWWDVGYIGGWLGDIIDLAESEPVGTPALRESSLRRWSTFPAAMETQIANLQAGLAHGYSAPRPVVERSITQVDAVIASPVDASPFYSPAARDSDGAFAARTRALTEGPVRATLLRYRRYLNDVYLPRSRTTLGIGALPNGAACYRAIARRYTSLDEPLDQLFARAEAANAAGLRDALDAGAALYGTRDLRELLLKARSDPAERYASSAEMLEDTRAVAARARQAFAPLFLDMPAQRLLVEPYPAARRGLGLPPRYMPSGKPDVPAVTWVPDERFAAMPRGLMRSTILHEGIPGHHMIGARMAEKSTHPLLRIAYQWAFDEGWAVYSEGLADAAGMAPSAAGRVVNGINRSKDGLLDIGIHQRGWDKEAAERYFADRGGLGREPDGRIARVAAFPGQQLSYTAGEVTIRALRAEAEQRLGSRFSLAAFHEAVLRDGWVPLWYLKQNVRRWIAEQEQRS